MANSTPAHRLATILTAAALLGLALASIAGCRSKGTVVNPTGGVVAPFDGPSVLRGTVGASADLIGIQPTLVSGLGIVVGTQGQGSPLPQAVEATVIRQLSLREGSRGIDMFQGTPFEGESPESFLRRPDVSVVAVLAMVAPGAPESSTFDVLVYALNNEELTGGHLWRTDLRLGRPTVQGGPATRMVGFAEGPVYVNPFASGPAANKTQGRVIGGGHMTNPLELAIRLNVPSPRRTRAIAAMINSRFGNSPVDRGDIASGRLTGQADASTSLVTISIPWSYKDRPEEFLRLVAHINPDAQGREERYAGRYIQALREEPGSADRLAWALEALGPVVIRGGTTVSSLYDWPEIAPRMAALRVGAKLGDPNAERPLIAIARGSDPAMQLEAIRLLGALGTGAMIDSTLQELAADELVSVRVAAYEAMARRAGMRELQEMMTQRSRISPGEDPIRVLRDWSEYARTRFRGSLVQGLQRDIMPGGFVIDRVPIGEPLIYLRQQGLSGLVLFGPEMVIEPGAVLRVSDDLILARPDVGEPDFDPQGYDVRVRYRPRPVDWLSTSEQPGVMNISNAPAVLYEFVEFLATRPTTQHPTAGLGMSFGNIVSVVEQLQSVGALKAQWQVERNTLRDGVDRFTRGSAADRPELEGDQPGGVDPLQDYIQRSIRGETGTADPSETAPDEQG